MSTFGDENDEGGGVEGSAEAEGPASLPVAERNSAKGEKGER